MPLDILVFYPEDDADIAVKRESFEFDDDLDALEAAEHLAADGHAVDVWAGDKLIAQVKKGNEPLNVKDAHSG